MPEHVADWHWMSDVGVAGTVMYMPAAQRAVTAKHDVPPYAGWYVPVAHGVHTHPLSEYEPGGHGADCMSDVDVADPVLL